jgi:epoxyqueuosine reductase
MSVSSELIAFIRAGGADLAGIADLAPLKRGLHVVPADLLDPYVYAVSIVIRLDSEIIDVIIDGPTQAYSDHCRSINAKLNDLAARIAAWIAERHHAARAIAASQSVDEKRLLGSISHKAVAVTAGLGWQGKSLLLVTPQYGPRVRLATILTDMPLDAGMPVRNRCGTCRECTNACPAQAIRNVSTSHHYERREDAVELDRCHAKLLEFKARPEIGYTFCGVCIAACPFGKRG